MQRQGRAGWRQAVAAFLLVLSGSAVASAQGIIVQQRTTHSLHAHYLWRQVAEHPTETLKCPGTLLPVGIQYVKGRVVDRLSFFCAEPAYDTAQNYFRTRRTTGVTVSAGGPGGEQPHEIWCPDGMVLSGVHGVNYNWNEPWMLATVGIDCGRLERRNNRWRVPEHDTGGTATSHAQGLRSLAYAMNDKDNYNSAGFVAFYNDSNKKTFVHYCPRTPLEGLEVAVIDWKLFLGGTTKAVLGFRWTCF